MSCNIMLSLNKKAKNKSDREYKLQTYNLFREINSKSLCYMDKCVCFLGVNYTLDEKFKKFTVGSEKYHKTGRDDHARFERIEWPYLILSNLDKCKNCPDYNFKNSGRHTIECISKKYRIVLTYDKINDVYLILTAFKYKGK